MKVHLEIRKLFWLINSVLIAILVYIVVGFILANNAGKSTFAYPIPRQEKVEIIPSKSPLLPVEHKIIIERNIFGSSGLSAAKKNQLRKNNDAPISVIKAQFRLCATVAGDKQIACAVIEDLKSKVQVIYKRGEIIEGARIERIDRNKIVLFYGGQLEVLNLHVAREVLAPIEKDEEPVMAQKQDATELVDDILPYERGINKRAFTKQVPAIKVFLEKIEVAPYIINGQQEGLSITGLDDFSMAGYFGFENGDVIQTINGQMLTGKQKAFQVLKKARSQSSLNFQLLRNQHKLDLSFEIKR
jgi:type II secretion system protein C